MQRRQIGATVAAVTMSVVSGVIAFGANTGTLGFAAPQTPAPTAVTAPAPTNPDAPNASADSRSGEARSRTGHRGGPAPRAARPRRRLPKAGDAVTTTTR